MAAETVFSASQKKGGAERPLILKFARRVFTWEKPCTN